MVRIESYVSISDDRSISTIIIKKSLKKILQISKGMAYCLVPNKALIEI